jgi:hypothetical protein
VSIEFVQHDVADADVRVETLDHAGTVRQVRPELNNGTNIHRSYDSKGNYTESWLVEIDLESVRGVFREVLAGRMTREAADRWAFGPIQQSETGTVIFVPELERKRIWDGIMYLYGIDSMEEPGK